MEQRMGGRGMTVRNIVGDRLSQYSNQPNSKAKCKVAVPQHSAQQVSKPPTISVPLARLKPQYRTIVDGANPMVTMQTKSARSVSGDGYRSNQTGTDTNNNMPQDPKPAPQKPQEKQSGDKASTKAAKGASASPHKKTETLKEKVVKCICNRPKTHILCTICGYSSFGHVRQPCYAHLQVTYLLEMSCCPRCNSGRLMEVSPMDPASHIP